MQRIADTGLLKAFLDRSDEHHHWAYSQFREHAPFDTCEAVLDELAYLIHDARLGMKLVERGDLNVTFSVAENIGELLRLLEKYSDLPMQFADACVVRMTELTNNCKVWTVDREDFQIYRRNGRQTIPCEFPKIRK